MRQDPNRRKGREPAKAEAAAAVMDRQSDSRRQRAPKTDGRRAQLTVPAEIWERAMELAELAGTTPNDVLATFAAKGMRVAEIEFQTAQRAAERVAAYKDRDLLDAEEHPDAEELVEAARLLRKGG